MRISKKKKKLSLSLFFVNFYDAKIECFFLKNMEIYVKQLAPNLTIFILTKMIKNVLSAIKTTTRLELVLKACFVVLRN